MVMRSCQKSMGVTHLLRDAVFRSVEGGLLEQRFFYEDILYVIVFVVIRYYHQEGVVENVLLVNVEVVTIIHVLALTPLLV
jgi:hypothetical protein